MSFDDSSKMKSKIKITPPASFAAGAKGVQVALKHAIDEMGPVKAMKALAKLNQEKGFDCPGCAWPDPDDKRSLFAEYCENGAKAVAEEATNKRTGPDFFADHSIASLQSWSDYELGKSGRLTHPLYKAPGASHYVELSWSKAFDTIARNLNALKDPNEAVFYTSGRSSNEAAFLWGLFARAFGTNNMPDCSNMCHESSGVALSQTLGIGKGSVVLDDFKHADVIIVAGQNPGTNHPRMLSALQECKLKGGKVITINPLEEAGLKRFKNPQKPMDYFTQGTSITDVFLQVKINQDLSLVKAILMALLKMHREGWATFDLDFIKQSTEGYEALVNHLDQCDYDQLIAQSGVSKEEVQKAVELLAPANKIICCWAMGLTQHHNAVDTIKQFVNLLLLKGSVGIKGGGTCPVRGHSNVQGDRTVGIMHHVSPQLNASLKEVFNIQAPEETGLDVVASIQAMYEKKAKVFVALGGNLLSAVSDTHYAQAAFEQCALTVSIATKLNRSHLACGNESLILPTLGRSEKDVKNGKKRLVTVENSMGKVHASSGHLTPASKLLMSEPEIVGSIAAATLGEGHQVAWKELGQDYAKIRASISRVIKGFEAYNQRIMKDGFYLPNNARERDFSKLPNGRAQFTVSSSTGIELNEDEFLLMTIRSHDQFNTTIYGMHDRYRGVYNSRDVIFMNRADMSEYGLSKLDQIGLVSTYDGVERKVHGFYVVPYDIPRQNLAGYFPELNPLIPINQTAEQSNTPISKSVKVKVLLP